MQRFVPPLHPLGRSSGSAPPTGRSGSSSATSRTGGGNTARSTDSKGTPRDCERLPLGAWPQKGGSGTVNMEDFSTQPVVQSVECLASWCVDLSREIEVMRHVIMQENSRLKDQLRVLTEESRGLRDRLESCLHVGPAAGLNCEALAAPPGGGAAAPAMQRRVVEWRIHRVDSLRAAEHGAVDCSTFQLPEYPEVDFLMSFGARRRGRRRLEEERGAEGGFEREAGSAPAGASQAWAETQPHASDAGCRLALRIAGPGTAGLRLHVRLEAAELTGGDKHRCLASDHPTGGSGAVAPVDDDDDSSCSSSDGPCSDSGGDGTRVAVPLGRLSAPVLLEGGPGQQEPRQHQLLQEQSLQEWRRSGTKAKASCDCNWPSRSCATVVCRAELEFAGFCHNKASPTVQLVTTVRP